MGVGYNPRIVTNGLMFCLDAVNPRSYPGSGTTWSDLSANKKNATLTNSPTYTSGSAAAFTFVPASSQYASANDLGNMSTWTIESWFQVTSSLSGVISTVVCNQYDLTSKLNFSMGTNRATSNYNLCVGFFDGAWRNTNGFAPSLNTWYHVVGTYDGTTVKQYVNNALDTSLTYSGTPQSGGEVRIGRRWDDTVSSANLFPGKISVIRIYNRALTVNEISQNFSATRSRYGI